MFENKAQPNIQEFYSNEDFIYWNNEFLTRTKWFEGYFKENQVDIFLKKYAYSPPPLLKPYKDGLLEFRKKYHKFKYGKELRMWPGHVTRLSSIDLSNDKISMKVQKLDFDDLIISNYSMDVHIDIWNKTIREQLAPPSKLLQFTTSELANQIGVGALVLTADNYIILQKRSSDPIVNPNTITHSVAGNTKFKPSYFKNNNPSIFKAIKSQAYEELSIPENWFTDLILMGGSRSAEWGGSPSFRFVGRVSKSFEEFIDNLKHNTPEDEWEYDKFSALLIPDNLESASKVLKKFTNKNSTQLTSATVSTFYFFDEFLSAGYEI